MMSSLLLLAAMAGTVPYVGALPLTTNVTTLPVDDVSPWKVWHVPGTIRTTLRDHHYATILNGIESGPSSPSSKNALHLLQRGVDTDFIMTSHAPVIPKKLGNAKACYEVGMNKDECAKQKNTARCWYRDLGQKPGYMFHVDGSGPWYHDQGRGLLDNVKSSCRARHAGRHWHFDYWTGGDFNAGRASFKIGVSRGAKKCVENAIRKASEWHFPGVAEEIGCVEVRGREIRQVPEPPVERESNNKITAYRLLPQTNTGEVSWIFYAKGDWFADGGRGFFDNVPRLEVPGRFNSTLLDNGWHRVVFTMGTHHWGNKNSSPLTSTAVDTAVYLSSSFSGALYGTKPGLPEDIAGVGISDE